MSCSFSNQTPLHGACEGHAAVCHLEVVQLLLSRKAAVDARDSRYRPYPCIVDFLLYCASNTSS
jgi:hypothetical protein